MSNLLTDEEYKSGLIQEGVVDTATAAGITGLGHTIMNNRATIASGGKKLLKALPIGSLAMAVEDGVDGYRNPDKYFTQPDNTQRTASVLGALANGTSFGVVPRREATLGLAGLLGSPKKEAQTLAVPTKEDLTIARLLKNK